MKNVLLFAALILLAGCGGTTSGAGPRPKNEKVQNRSFVGRWDVQSVTCGGQPTAAKPAEWFSIDSSESVIAHIQKTESTTDHECHLINALRFTLMGFEKSDVSTVHRGAIQHVANRTVCYRMVNGEREKKPYADRTGDVQNEAPQSATLTSDGRFTFETKHPLFCSGRVSKFELSAKPD